MNETKKLIGHRSQLNLLLDNYHQRFPHTLLFNGIKGIGKFTTAMILLEKIYKNKKNKEQFVFTINTDENKPAMIDDIRSSINQISLTNSSSNQRSFMIIDNADNLNFNSFNALLKTLEEPPKNTVILIISHDIQKIPKTIISRCTTIKFNCLKKQEVKEYCDINKIDSTNFDLEKNYEFYGGSIEKLLFFVNGNGVQLINQLKKITSKEELVFSEFEEFYSFMSSDYEKYLKIMMNCIFTFQKNKYLTYYKNKLIIRKILKFFKNIDSFFEQNLNIDKKKELHFLLTEYISTNVNE